MIEDTSSEPTRFHSPPSVYSEAGAPRGWEPPTPEDLQAEIPTYRVLEILGRGGMGAVYKGWQLSLERYVAIKVLPPGIDDRDAQFATRFKQEAKTMAKFQHPGIVAVFDAGETTGGLLYIVMEFVEGTDVAGMVQVQGRLSPEHALAITAHVCDALHYAHAHGVIHRDIKPANIMVNRQGQVKVADFGLAKANEPGSRGLTKSNMTLGTPDYIAPECLVTGVVPDQRADLYAVGVMLYNMLTGEIPRGRFKAASDKIGSDRRFDGIIDRAMESDREARYSDAMEVRRDLDRILTTPLEKADAAPSQPPSPPPPQRKPVMRGPGQSPPSAEASTRSKNVPVVKKKRTLVLAACVIGVILVFGGLYGFWQSKSRGSTDAEGLQWHDWIVEQRQSGAIAKGFEDDGQQFRVRDRALIHWSADPDPETHNGALRATWTPALGAAFALDLRYSKNGGLKADNYYRAGVQSDGQKIEFEQMLNGKREKLQTWSWSAKVDPHEEHVFEFRAVGNELSLRINGEVVATIHDDALREGGFGFSVHDGTTIRKMEYAVLDKAGPSSSLKSSSTGSKSEAGSLAVASH